MFQIRFGKKTFSYFIAGSEHRFVGEGRCVVFFCWRKSRSGDRTKEESVHCLSFYHNLSCMDLLYTDMPEKWLYFQLAF